MNHHKKKLLVKHLVLILKELQTGKEHKTQIIDDYYTNLLRSLPKENQELAKNLIHYLTLLNKNYREQEKGIYQSIEEDIFITLELIQDLIKPQSILTRREQNQLEEIEQEYLGEDFTRKQVQNLLKLSKSQTHRLVNKLENLNLIHKESTPKNSSHVYSFGIPNLEIQALFRDNQNIEFTDIR